MICCMMKERKRGCFNSPIERSTRLEVSTEELEVCYRTCELMEDYIERVKTLIGKMLDEREDMEAEDEGE